MKILLSWLKEILDIDKTPSEIADILTMLGHEVEELIPAGDDTVFDISITPNRPDCLSLTGIARELAVGLWRRFVNPLPELTFVTKKEKTDSSFHIVIDDPLLCPRYTGRIIKNIKISESPSWLKKRLELCGLRSINNVVDVTNYVMLYGGHPLHAFDLNTLKGNIIRIAVAGRDQSITTLDGVKRILPEDTLLIWDAERPVAIAGIMGGLDTEVRSETRDIFLEAAYFSPFSIRRSSKQLGLRTEASYRFERGTDIEGLLYCTDLAVKFILELCGGELTDVLDEYPARFETRDITLRLHRVKRTIGDEIRPEEIEEILGLLDLSFKREADLFIVKTLSRRPDIKTEIDLIEEIARVKGYERIPAEMPSIRLSSTLNEKLKDIEFITSALRAKGFSEVINYSFMDMERLKFFSIPEGDKRLKAVQLKNPLRKEESFLRTNLTISLLETLNTNIRYGIGDLRIFEISKVFFDKGWGLLPEERLHLGMILWSDSRPVLWKDTINPYYILREVLDGIFHEFWIQDVRWKPSEEPFLLPGQSADIYLNGEKAGYIGSILQKTIDMLDIKTETPVTIAEIDLELVFSLKGYFPIYRQIPRYPYIQRDVALIVDMSVTGEVLKEIVLSYPSGLIESVRVFDCFRGGNIPQDKKSIGIRIIYRAKDRTLTDEEVEDLHHRVVEELLQKTEGKIR